MSDTYNIDLVGLVDGVIRDLLAEHVPPSPKSISNVLTEVFCEGFGNVDRRDYAAQLEYLVRERVMLALAHDFVVS